MKNTNASNINVITYASSTKCFIKAKKTRFISLCKNSKVLTITRIDCIEGEICDMKTNLISLKLKKGIVIGFFEKMEDKKHRAKILMVYNIPDNFQ